MPAFCPAPCAAASAGYFWAWPASTTLIASRTIWQRLMPPPLLATPPASPRIDCLTCLTCTAPACRWILPARPPWWPFTRPANRFAVAKPVWRWRAASACTCTPMALSSSLKPACFHPLAAVRYSMKRVTAMCARKAVAFSCLRITTKR